jgi:hypothetical protein
MVVLISSFPAGNDASAQTRMAIGEAGSEIFVFGTELWAMSQIALKPQFGIDLASVEVADEGERLNLLRAANADVAVVRARIPSSYADQMRTVMAIWPDRTSAGGSGPAQLVARKDVPDNLIYRLTKAIFENGNFFSGTRQQLGQASVERATMGIDLPLHPGASRYYQEAGIRLAAGMTGATAGTARFEDFDDQALDDDERVQVAAACRQALDLGALSAVLGDLSSTGCEAYQSYLEDQERVERVAAAANADKSDDFNTAGGTGGPAITLESLLGELEDARIPKSYLTYKPDPRQPTM